MGNYGNPLCNRKNTMVSFICFAINKKILWHILCLLSAAICFESLAGCYENNWTLKHLSHQTEAFMSQILSRMNVRGAMFVLHNSHTCVLCNFISENFWKCSPNSPIYLWNGNVKFDYKWVLKGKKEENQENKARNKNLHIVPCFSIHLNPIRLVKNPSHCRDNT